MVISNESRLNWLNLVGFGKRGKLPAYLECQSTQYVFLARNAIYHGLKILGIRAGQKILVPAYHCSAIVDPIQAFGAKVVFYRIAPDCSPDLEDVKSKLDNQTKAILAVHYFGFPAPVEQLKAFCATHKLFLIEDCAHVFKDSSNLNTLGSHGHISFFSFKKFLPVYDGGCLMINMNLPFERLQLQKEGAALSLKVAKNLLERVMADSSDPTARSLGNLLIKVYRGMRVFFPRKLENSKVLGLSVTAPRFDSSFADLPMTRLSQRVLRSADFGSIVERRRANYNYLVRATVGLRGFVPLHPQLPEVICPWVFPAFSTQVKNLHKQLREHGVAAFAWDGVIHPTLPLEEFPEVVDLYNNLICLPIHQDLKRQDLDFMVEILKGLILGTDSK
ncbi:dTDP-4-amino-4,6-dideoxygalactose transaminase [Nitrosospira multiformis]|uniref:dTDP-4-amino-4,6-dideoxygalactose transaminase n=1 Tax=Nitrosospira multiformis TaxID=1231 RepID=A0A1H8B452_9PROT|nr:DegT/DnrJ/EryC1/StrS family aminotransferase [Nitrosospira multiformis]SEM77109.1 dTDP-4-amino-4,6-dideoxygalactose transaminase [Nitrosospira multiformis]